MKERIQIGQRFGELTVLKKTDRKWNSYNIWECLCICGKKTTTSEYYLLKGKSTSCGIRGHTVDLSGKKFGKLLVIKKAKKNKFSSWLCKCDCGENFIAETRGLIYNRTKSCGCDLRPHLEGQHFGKLLVIKEKPQRVSGSVIWECLCDCGNKVYPSTYRLIHGGSKSCGKCTKNDLTGKKFGRLTAIKYSGKKIRTDKVWMCDCDCGKREVEVRSAALVSGNTQSCGCLKLIYADRTVGAKKTLFRSYIAAAKRKNIKFELTFEDFLSITRENCFYCGSVPNNKRVTNKVNKSEYIYNGIDRVDNKMGYIKSNCVPCCAFCNMAKKDMSIKEFLWWSVKLYNNLKNWNINE